MADTVDVRGGGAVPGHGLREYEIVVVLVPAVNDAGQVVPAGSVGTVVDADAAPGWYEVDFDEPFTATVTLTNVQVAPLAD